MQLCLQQVAKTVQGRAHLYPINMDLQPGAVTVLLGATQAGKTSLMRIMAGLDVPSQGEVLVDAQKVNHIPVRQRNVAMVYQQFINYPSMTVFDNIASPLKLRGDANITERVHALAERLHIAPFLQRLPAQLSGGQQQRVALARALAKNAPLMLLDEPLVNLDYKLREELREELSTLFATGDSTVVYATTEPSEALLLGGYTAVLDAGELLQYGPTAQVFHQPQSLRVARAFSDPPMNFMRAQAHTQAGLAGVQITDGPWIPVQQNPSHPLGGTLTAGVRASVLHTQPGEGDAALRGQVELAEISGSDTYVHATTAVGDVVAQLNGVRHFALGDTLTLYFDPAQVYVFDAQGNLAVAPQRGDRGGA
jgi:glycerol transport system ATP-binding protein